MLRTVQFWRVANTDGSDLVAQFPATKVVRVLREAERRGRRRYRIQRDGTEVLGQGLSNRPHPSLALHRTRRVNLPRLDDLGQIRPLTLRQGQALAEPTFFSFLPRNIVATLFNNNGPRAGRLEDYLNAKFSCDISLVPIYREDLSEVLEAMRVTAIDVSIPSAQAAQLSGGGDWAEMLDNAHRLLEDGAIQVKISIGRGGRGDAKARRLNRLRELVEQLRTSKELGRFTKAKVYGADEETGDLLRVDLLEQKFIARVEVPAEENTVPEVAAREALSVMDREWHSNRDFLTAATPDVPAAASGAGLVGDFIENPDDERDRET